MPITVRLTLDDHDLLKESADDECIPPAILARTWITAELKRRAAGRRVAPTIENNEARL